MPYPCCNSQPYYALFQELSCGGYDRKVEKCDFDITGQFLASVVLPCQDFALELVTQY